MVVRNRFALITFFCIAIVFLAISAVSISANVFINEIMPSPANVDWDLSGTASSSDEWIELYNNGSQAINLSGWILNDTLGTSTTNFVIPNNYPLLQPNNFNVFYKAKIGSTFATQITLDTNGDTVKLYNNTGNLIDTITYSSNPGNDIAFGRERENSTILKNLTYPTPDRPNGNCTIPIENLYLVRNTVLCNGNYTFALGGGNLLVLYADNLSLDLNGATLKGDGTGFPILLLDSTTLVKSNISDVVIMNGKLDNFDTGILGFNTTNVLISSLEIVNNKDSLGFGGIGIDLANSKSTFVLNSYLANNSAAGITGFNTLQLTVSNSVFENNTYGLALNYSLESVLISTVFKKTNVNDILLKDNTTLFLANTTSIPLTENSTAFTQNSNSLLFFEQFVTVKVIDSNGPVENASVQVINSIGTTVIANKTNVTGKTPQNRVVDFLRNATYITSLNNHTFKINSTDPKHLFLQESKAVNYSGEYAFILLFEQVKPGMQITSPSNSSIVKGVIDFNASASDNAALENVSFYIDNVLKQTNYSNQTTGLFTFKWNSSEVNDSNHILKAAVFDSAGNSNNTEILVQVNNVNLAPNFSSVPAQPIFIAEDSTISFLLGATDQDPGETLTFSKNVTFGSLNSLNATATNFTFTPNNSHVGLNNIRFTVADSGNLTGTFDVLINVTNTNDAPTITSTSVTNATEDILYTYDVNAADVDPGDTLIFSLVTMPAGMTINSSSGLITWTPADLQTGNNNVTVRVNDSSNAIAEQQFTINVTAVNDAPVFAQSLQNLSVNEDSLLYYDVNCTDEESTNLTYYENASQFAINSVSGNFTWAPTNNDVGSYKVNFICSDGQLNISQAITVTVANTNDAPVLNTVGTNNVVQAVEDSVVAFSLTANDDDLVHGSSAGESLTYTANDTRFTITKINNTLANVTLLPVNSDVPRVNVMFRVTDISNTTSTQIVQVNVTNTNDAPQITSFYPVFDNPKISQLGRQGFNVSLNDTDMSDILTLTWEAKDANNNSALGYLSIGSPDNRINFTANGTTGNFVIKVTVKDLSNATITKIWALTVADKPVASTFDTSLTTNFSAIANLSDVANVTLGKSVSGQPAQVLGLVSFKQNLNLSNVVDLDNFVNISKGFVRIDSKQLPQLNKSAKLVMQALDFKSAPILKVDLEDGSGFVNCPAALCTNLSYNVNLTKDGSGILSFEVTHFTSYQASSNTTNQAPIIISSPVLTGKERTSYQYNVVAVDPNNDTLTYSLLSSVSGMSINNATGLISWTPDFSQNGTYNVTLRASDSSLSAEQSYNLTISAASRLSITEIKLKIDDDEDGDKKDALVNGAKSRDIKPGQNIEVTVKIENLFTKTDFEINDVDVEAVIKNIDDDDDLDDEDENIDLDAGDEEKAKLNFEIPIYADKGEYKLIITASGRGSDGIDYRDNATVFLVVDKKNHELAITKALLSPPTLNCAYDTVLQVVANNLGKDDEDDGLLVIENSLLNLSIRELLDLEEGTGDSDDDSTYSKFYPIKLSKDLEAGTYDIRLSTYYDKAHLSKEKTVQLVVEDCLEQKKAEVKQTVLEKTEKSEDEVVVVEKSAEKMMALVPELTAFDATQEEIADTSFQTTLIIIALILLTGMGILLVGALVIKH
ncbi:tandem-95 repeat protein [Candidatus Woesearchaeota archaeon]|nr:tandem-95 repeat protein [Candidatus Woesearchaeota archaeon]